MASVRFIKDDAHYQAELSSAPTSLIVVEFTASWCGPCQRMAPIFEQLARKYPKAVFMKVDVDKSKDVAASQGITSMPTFIFYRNKTKVDLIKGADPKVLESKVLQYYGIDDGEEGGDSALGHIDLLSFIHKQECESLNESDQHPLSHCLNSGPEYLESDCDGQLIINVPFTQAVKVHSLKIKAPQDKGPKTVKLFINQPHTLDFDQADANQAVQEIQLTPDEVEGNPVNLRFVKFQNVRNLQLFVKDNQAGSETTQIEHLAFFGSPIATTNMDEFKRVAGKKGERD